MHPKFEEKFKFDDIYLGYNKEYEVRDLGVVEAEVEKSVPMTYIAKILVLGKAHLVPAQLQKITDKKFMSFMSEEALTKASAKAIGTLYAELCRENKQISIDFIQTCVEHIANTDFDGHR